MLTAEQALEDTEEWGPLFNPSFEEIQLFQVTLAPYMSPSAPYMSPSAPYMSPSAPYMSPSAPFLSPSAPYMFTACS
eukprot:3461229-Rhodomonas_salina.2